MAVKEGISGVTAKTPQNIAFGAGTVHKGLKYADGKWNFAESIIGATKGGNSLEIVPEIYEVEPDGAGVSIKGLTVKVGEEATLTINGLELSSDLLKAAVIGTDGTSEDTNYNVVESKSFIEEGDYFENIAFVGQTLGNKRIIVILDNALCTSGLKLEGQNKEAGTVEYVFKCHADVDGDLDRLPYHIYYPTAE